jgi:hypothetical protein
MTVRITIKNEDEHSSIEVRELLFANEHSTPVQVDSFSIGPGRSHESHLHARRRIEIEEIVR